MMRGAASLVAHQGLATSVALAVAFVLIAVGVYLPAAAARATLVLAIVVAAVIWVFVQAFGGILASGATDPESGPAARRCSPWLTGRPATGARPAPAAALGPPPAEGNLAR